MSRAISCLVAVMLVIGLIVGGVSISPRRVAAADKQVERGRYLVTLGGCLDCHTPGYFLGKPDMSRYLGGSDVGFYPPGVGTFYGRNLTPDNDTGLGAWTKEQIVTAITKGKRPDGRGLVPVMPWRAYAKLTKVDAYGDRRFRQDTAAGEEPGAWSLWPE